MLNMENNSTAEYHQQPIDQILSTIPAHNDHHSQPSTLDPNHTNTNTLKWHQRPLIRALLLRITIRLLALTLFITLIQTNIIPFSSLLHSYTDYIHSQPLSLATCIFTLCSIPFSAFTPGSYAPTVLAGATFPLYIAIPIAYLSMNMAALLNILVMRHCAHACWTYIAARIQRRLERSPNSTRVSALTQLLHVSPVKTIVLLRLPYLASGILNYYFSSIRTLSIRHQIIGNAIGLLPGSILFSVLGGQARTLAEIVWDGHTDATSITVFVLITTIVIVSIAGIVYMVRKKTAQQAAQVMVVEGEVSTAESDDMSGAVSLAVIETRMDTPVTPVIMSDTAFPDQQAKQQLLPVSSDSAM